MTVSANESRKIMERIGFPQEAVDTIGDCTERVSENADFNALVDEFITIPRTSTACSKDSRRSANSSAKMSIQ